MKDFIKKEIEKAMEKLLSGKFKIIVRQGGVHADYSTNIVFKKVERLARALDAGFGDVIQVGKKDVPPLQTLQENAEFLRKKLLESEDFKKYVSKIEIVNGFLNFWIKDEVFVKNIGEIIKTGEKYGSNDLLKGKKIMIEYTDPNPFKEFHIGHLMSNAIGESIARMYEARGADVNRACYQGDVGLHVAKAIWGKLQKPEMTWGEAYAYGTMNYENNKEEVEEINRKIFSASDKEINELYKQGREESLEHFKKIYKILDTKFDYNFFESKEGIEGKVIVEEFLKKGVFEKSDGAIVFHGEEYGLHTRVFVSSQGLPTYEAKELGLNRAKFDKEPDISQSIVITANEQSDYFRVVLKAMEQIFPDIAKKTKHIGHGLLRFASGKMSSRKGNVITGESLIGQVKELVFEKIKECEFSESEKEKIAEVVAIAAIKYSILKQAIGGDIIYDFKKSISFEGDSGPYLQYTYVRAMSVLKMAKEKGIKESLDIKGNIGDIEKILLRFPEVVEDAMEKYAPNYICSYLIELAHAFNSYYSKFQIVGEEKESPYRVSLTKAVAITIKNGLNLLGISAPEKM